MPRVRNQDFANFMDATFTGRVNHINNKRDLVPIVSLGYYNCSGEVHMIQDSGEWIECPAKTIRTLASVHHWHCLLYRRLGRYVVPVVDQIGPSVELSFLT